MQGPGRSRAATCPPSRVPRSCLFLLLRLLLLAARQRGCGERCRGTGRRADADRLGVAPVSRRQRPVETALVPEIRLGAAQATVARLDRPAGALVPLQRGAGVVGDRSLAAQLVQA